MKDYLQGIIISTAAIFAPAKAMVLITLLLVFVDLITGVMAAKKRGEWKTFSELKSAGIRRSVTKILVYETAILLGYLVETYMIDGLFPVSKLAAGLISVVELKSVLENLDTINAQPIFKTLIEKLGSINDTKKDGES